MDEAAAMEEYGNALILAVINRRKDLFDGAEGTRTASEGKTKASSRREPKR
jgi:hypothetical protein